MGETLLGCVVLSACVALAFVLSGMEAGVMAMSRFRLRRQMRAGIRRAQLLHGYLENPEEFLWTILVGNTLATFAVFCVIGITLYNGCDGRPVLFAAGLALAVF